MDSLCTLCGARVDEFDFACPTCGRPIATALMSEPDVLASPGHHDQEARRGYRWLAKGLGVVALVLLLGTGLFLAQRGSDPREIVEEFANAYANGDCEQVADAFHYQDANDRASEAAICRQGLASSTLVSFEVTGVDQSLPGLDVPGGASEVVRVGYTVEFRVGGEIQAVEDTFVVAKFDGDWGIVFQRSRPPG